MRQRERVGISFEGQESLTHQSFGPEADINNVIARHGIKPPEPGSLQYFDNTSFTSFHDAVEQVRQAQDAFDELPARTREIFHNDPGVLIAAVEAASTGDQLAIDSLVKAGFIEAKEKLQPADQRPATTESTQEPTNDDKTTI